MSTSISASPTVSRRTAVLGLAITAVVAAVGLSWAKWLPYAQRAGAVAASGSWKGSSLLATGAGENPFARAWDFTLTYGSAVWKALLVALVVATVVDVLVPRRWLVRALGRRTPLGGSVAGGLAALPGMMCTCCAAPLAVTMRRAGVPLPAALAFWLGNPVLNPAVLVFLALLAPSSWVAVRLGVGILLVLGFSALVGAVVARRGERAGTDLPAAREALEAADEPLAWGEVPRRLVVRFARLAVVLVPEYLLVVFVVGLIGAPLGELLGQGGALAVLLAALIATVLVLPTAGEIPILLGLAAAGASAGVLGALLIALPAISLPSAVMVGRALGWRATAATAGATVVAGLVAGGLLAAFA